MTRCPMKLNNAMLVFWKSAVVTAFILFLCLLPANSLQKIDLLKVSYEDLAVHFLMFLGFSFVFFRELTTYADNTVKPIRVLSVTITVSLILGFGTEMLQYLLVRLNRSANLGDFLFDTLGIVAGITAAKFIRR
jgi:hypothetical protein